MDWIRIETKWNEMARRLQNGLPPLVDGDSATGKVKQLTVPADAPRLTDDSVAV